jgi:hypothetical protein
MKSLLIIFCILLFYEAWGQEWPNVEPQANEPEANISETNEAEANVPEANVPEANEIEEYSSPDNVEAPNEAEAREIEGN